MQVKKKLNKKKVINGNKEMINILIENQENINQKFEEKSLYEISLINNDKETAKHLFKKGINMKMKNEKERNGLFVSIKYNMNEILEKIIKIMDLNEKDYEKNTVLIYSIKRKNIDAFKLILESGVELFDPYYEKTPFYESCKYNFNPVSEYILENHIEKIEKKELSESLKIICEKNNFELLEKIIKLKIIKNYEKTLLTIACINNSNEVVKLLIENNKLINKDDESLYYAIKGHNEYIVLFLIKNGLILNFDGIDDKLEFIKKTNNTMKRILLSNFFIHQKFHIFFIKCLLIEKVFIIIIILYNILKGKKKKILIFLPFFNKKKFQMNMNF
jgi:ankyrin repeat protein